jgi:hypothetical protein
MNLRTRPFLVSFTVFLNTLCLCGASDFLKASFTIDVELMRSEDSIPLEAGRGMITALGSGSFAFDFVVENRWERERVLADGTFQLTSYEPLSLGTAKDCIVTLSEDQYKPRKMTALCNHWIEEEEHQLQFLLKDVPKIMFLHVEWDCGGVSKTMPDPATLVQLCLPLAKESWWLIVKLGEITTETRKVPLGMGLVGEVTITAQLKEHG